MTYNVFGGTLNLAQLQLLDAFSVAQPVVSLVLVLTKQN